MSFHIADFADRVTCCHVGITPRFAVAADELELAGRAVEGFEHLSACGPVHDDDVAGDGVRGNGAGADRVDLKDESFHDAPVGIATAAERGRRENRSRDWRKTQEAARKFLRTSAATTRIFSLGTMNGS